MDAEQRASIADEGFDPDNRAVVVAMLRMHELLAHIGCICGRGQNVGKTSSRTVAGSRIVGPELRECEWRC